MITQTTRTEWQPWMNSLLIVEVVVVVVSCVMWLVERRVQQIRAATSAVGRLARASGMDRTMLWYG